MALAWLVDQLRDGDSIRLTNYGEFLDRNPPRSEARIVERSSWSCAHGVGRWKTDCGCHVGGEPGWNQQWRGPLREGLDGLRDELARLYEKEATKWLRDPWAARDDYLAVRLDPGPASRDGFFNAHAIGALAEQDRGRVLGLLESQVMALFMFTSCGWFFDDISGLEPIQDLQYAARAIDLVREWAPPELEDRLLNHLARAKANDPDYTDGADVYRKEVLPARMDPSRVAAHWVFGQLSEEAGACPVAGLARPVKKRRFAELGLTVAAATVDVTDPYTLVSTRLACLGLSSGGADLAARVGPMPLDLDALTDPVTEALTQADMDRLTELMDQALPGARAFGLDGLILDTRNRLLRGLSKGFFDDLRIFVLNQYDRHRDVLSLFRDAGLPTPEAEDFIFGTVIGVDLERILGEGREPGTLDLGALEALAQRSRIWGVAPSRPWLTQVINDFLRYRFELLAAQPDAASLKELAGFLDQARRARRDLDLWESQNTYDDLARSKDFQARLTPDARGLFAELGRSLGYLL
jgi:hypothetical protein